MPGPEAPGGRLCLDLSLGSFPPWHLTDSWSARNAQHLVRSLSRVPSLLQLDWLPAGSASALFQQCCPPRCLAWKSPAQIAHSSTHLGKESLPLPQRPLPSLFFFFASPHFCLLFTLHFFSLNLSPLHLSTHWCLSMPSPSPSHPPFTSCPLHCPPVLRN